MVKVGSRVRLISMGFDPHPIENGTCGTVMEIDSLGTIHVKWDNGRILGLIPSEDEFTVIG